MLCFPLLCVRVLCFSMLLFALLCLPLICFAVLSFDLLCDLLLFHACCAAICFAYAWLRLAMLSPAASHCALLHFAVFCRLSWCQPRNPAGHRSYKPHKRHELYEGHGLHGPTSLTNPVGPTEFIRLNEITKCHRHRNRSWKWVAFAESPWAAMQRCGSL